MTFHNDSLHLTCFSVFALLGDCGRRRWCKQDYAIRDPFSRTAELMPLIAAKSFLEIVGDVARVVSCKLIELTIVADRADSKAGSNWDTTEFKSSLDNGVLSVGT